MELDNIMLEIKAQVIDLIRNKMEDFNLRDYVLFEHVFEMLYHVFSKDAKIIAAIVNGVSSLEEIFELHPTKKKSVVNYCETRLRNESELIQCFIPSKSPITNLEIYCLYKKDNDFYFKRFSVSFGDACFMLTW